MIHAFERPLASHRDPEISPLSRTFIPARIEDNPVYVASGSGATLPGSPNDLVGHRGGSQGFPEASDIVDVRE